MHLLGKNLADHKALKIALTSFYGIGRPTALRVMARFQIHEHIKVGELTESQVTSLTSFLSTPSLVVNPMSKAADNPQLLGQAGAGPHGRMHFSDPNFIWKGDQGWLKDSLKKKLTQKTKEDKPDVLSTLLLENEGRRAVRENIAHHRNVGTWVGRRHAMGLPVRGGRSHTNANTAKKLNRIERRG